MSLLTELRRRKVFQVAAVYAVTAWLLIQISTSVEAPLNLPTWTDTLVIVLVAVGFPIALILTWAFDLTPGGIKAGASNAPAATRTSGPHWVFSGLQALVLIAVGFLIFEQYFSAESAAGSASTAAVLGSGRTERLSILAPRDYTVLSAGSPTLSIAISAAGDTVAYLTARIPSDAEDSDDEPSPLALAIRRLDSRSTVRLQSDDGARQPFFSPDGRWIGFFTPTGKMQKQLLDGGSVPVTIIDGINGAQWAFAVWLEDNRIVYSARGDPRIFIVSAEGGTPTPLTEPDPLNPELLFPTDFIPGTDIVLVVSASLSGNRQSLSLEALDVATGRRQLIVEDAGGGRYLPSGHLVFDRDPSLMISAFDLDSLTLTGPAIPLADAARRDSSDAVPQYAVARDGTLAYLPELDVAGRLVLVDPDGTVTPLPEPSGNYQQLSVTRDGARAAIRINLGNGESKIRIYDFGRNDMRVLTEQGIESSPEWRPDGRALALRTARAEVRGLVVRELDGRETMVEPTVTGGSIGRNASWHPDGDLIAYTRQLGDEHDIWIAQIRDDEVITEPLLTSAANEMSPRFSADGRWLAYVVSDDSASNVYVRAWPDGEPVAVWSDTALSPRWSKTGSELFFVGATDSLGYMHSVSVTAEASRPVFGDVDRLFPIVERNVDGTASGFGLGGNTGAGYDVLPDGRFLMVRVEDVARSQEIAITRNWLAELEGLAQ